MISGGNRDGFMSDINVTPFVDVMLVLLIIFMVTAPMIVQGVNVSLPEATSKPLSSKNEYLLITITKNNKVFINDIEVSLDFLKQKLVRILGNQKDRAIYLKADKDIPYGTVVQVMSEINEAGVEKLGMVTLPVSGDHNKKNQRQ